MITQMHHELFVAQKGNHLLAREVLIIGQEDLSGIWKWISINFVEKMKSQLG
jgi:hypothetical protein